MKVRNIMFFGFAAAILMGTANAAGTFQIASKAYVDSRVSSASSAASEVADAVGDMDDLGDTENSNITSGTDNLVDAVNDLDAALNTKQDKSNSQVTTAGNHLTTGYGVGANLEALDSALGAVEGVVGSYDSTTGQGTGLAADVAELQDAIGTLPANSNIADLLDGKVNVSDAATSIRTVAGGASDDKWATEKAVATVVEGLTGGGGTVGQQIADALGSDFTGQDAYTDVTAALADKQDKADSTVAAADVTAANHLTAGAGVADNLVALGNALGTVEGTVGDSNSGLVKDVADLQTAINGDANTDGLDDRIEDLETAVGDSSSGLVQLENLIRGYSDCITQAEALREPGDNSAAHCVLSASTSGGIEWTPVTFPWVAD